MVIERLKPTGFPINAIKMNKNASFILYQSLKMIYWSNLEQKGSVSPKQESRLVLASLLFIHTVGRLGDIYIVLHGCLTFPSQIAEAQPVSAVTLIVSA